MMGPAIVPSRDSSTINSPTSQSSAEKLINEHYRSRDLSLNRSWIVGPRDNMLTPRFAKLGVLLLFGLDILFDEQHRP